MKSKLAFFLLFVVGILAAGCSGGDEGDTSGAPPKEQTTEDGAAAKVGTVAPNEGYVPAPMGTKADGK